mmetsp:Transcript_6459/g.19961  ORF Transcript_6459/g.19961 Transcript_6459/m.19961 type:complete len:222 (-) Transcript_6459:6-671(-)
MQTMAKALEERQQLDEQVAGVALDSRSLADMEEEAQLRWAIAESLRVATATPAPVAPAAAPAAATAAGLGSDVRGPEGGGAAADAEEDSADALLPWLTEYGLAAYHARLLDAGITGRGHLLGLGNVELDATLEIAAVEPVDRERFLRVLRGGPAAGEEDEEASAQTAQAAECPVCLDGTAARQALLPCGHCYCAEHAERALRQGWCHTCRQLPMQSLRLFF